MSEDEFHFIEELVNDLGDFIDINTIKFMIAHHLIAALWMLKGMYPDEEKIQNSINKLLNYIQEDDLEDTQKPDKPTLKLVE